MYLRFSVVLELFVYVLVCECVCLCVFPQTPAEGAATVLYAALSPDLEGDCGGGYWATGRREMTTPVTFDSQLQLSLWDATQRLLGLQ